eukprot:5933219-Amphidinium_carterae.1
MHETHAFPSCESGSASAWAALYHDGGRARGVRSTAARRTSGNTQRENGQKRLDSASATVLLSPEMTPICVVQYLAVLQTRPCPKLARAPTR